MKYVLSLGPVCRRISSGTKCQGGLGSPLLSCFRVNGTFVGIIEREREPSILLRERVVARGFWGTKSRIQVTVGWVFWIFIMTLWSEPVSELYAVPVHVCTKKWIGIQLSGSQGAFWLTGYSCILLKVMGVALSVALRTPRIVCQSGAPERSRRLRPKACAKRIRLSIILSIVVEGDIVLSLVILLKVRCIAGTVLVCSSVVLVLRVDLLIRIVRRVVILGCDSISKVRCLGVD